MCANSASQEKETVFLLRSQPTLRSFLKKTGFLILSLGLVGAVSANLSANLLAQSTSVGSSQNFLSRLRPSFAKTDGSSNAVPAAPGAFSELDPSPGSNASSDSREWVNLGTDYATPSSEMSPDPTSNRAPKPQTRSFNPGTRRNAEAASFSPRPDSRASQARRTSASPSANLVSPSANAASLSANLASPSGLPAPFPVNQREFHLPIANFLTVIPENQLKEIRLYVSRDNGRSWKAYQTLNRSQIESLPSKNWGVRTASDGEFWFALRIVDQNGNEFPQNSAQPTWRILVNSTGKPLDSLMNQPTDARIAAVPGATGNSAGNSVGTTSSDSGLVARPQWSPTADDAQPTGATVASSVGANESGRASQSPNIVVYSVKDRGVNSIPDVSLPVYRIQNSNPMEAFQQLAESSRGKRSRHSAKPQYSDSEAPSSKTESPADFNESNESNESKASDESTVSLVADDLGLGSDSVAAPSDASITLDDSPLETDSDSILGKNAKKSGESDDLFLFGNESAMNEEGLNSKIRFMNHPELSIEYDVSAVGSSGVGRVELWSTLDDGMTWTYLAEDEDCVSPVQVALKSDGKYGFQILVFNGAGVGMERPQAGSAPQMEVVLDRIAPRVQIYSIQLQAEFGDLEIHWGAEDPNFGSNPVLLSWASSTEGPWRPMTTMPLENTGRFTWRIPDGIPGKVFIRIDVCDQAKNATTLVTGPVVTDVVRPTGVILDAKPR